MDFEITEEKLLEVAKRYGLEAKKSNSPGFVIKGNNVNVDELFALLFPNAWEEQVVHVEFSTQKLNAVKKESKVKINNMYKYRLFKDVGVA